MQIQDGEIERPPKGNIVVLVKNNKKLQLLYHVS